MKRLDETPEHYDRQEREAWDRIAAALYAMPDRPVTAEQAAGRADELIEQRRQRWTRP